MWSKRLADIRPITVISYLLLLLGVGYFRVIYGELSSYTFSFFGEEYILHSAWRWIFPLFVAFSSMLVNWVMAEKEQILKRYSYLGFLWGLYLLSVGSVSVVFLSTLSVVWFTSIVRLQGSKRVYADFLDIGLLTGFLSLFHVKLALLLIVSWFLLVAYGRLRTMSIAIGLWGLITIHILGATVAYVLGSIHQYKDYFAWGEIYFEWPSRELLPFLGIMLAYWFLSLGNFIKALTRANVVKRQSLSALLTLQIFVLVLGFTGVWNTSLILSFLPIGSLVFVANDLQYRSKIWWKEIEIWMFIAGFSYYFFS